MRHPGERVALGDTVGVRHILVAAGKRNRLEGDGLDLVDILRGKFYDIADGVVIDGVDDGGHKRDLDADGCEILDRLELHVKEIAHAAVLVLFLRNAVELQVNAVLPGLFRGLAEFDVLGIADAVGRGQDAVKTDLFGVRDGFEKMRRDGRLAARKQDDDLPARFERNGAVEDSFCVFKGRLVDIARPGWRP